MKVVKHVRRVGCLGAVLVAGVAALSVISMVDGADPGSTAPVGMISDIPGRMVQAYVRAAASMPEMVPACKGLTWQLLAGIGKVESGHASGRQIDPAGLVTPPIIGPILNGSGAGGNTTAIRDTDNGRWDGNSEYDAAVGPMQFLPSTFAGYSAKVRPDGTGNPNNADDETLAAALYLCGDGRDLTDASQLRKAVYSYNASNAYVDEVLRWATQYAALGSQEPVGDVSEKVRTAIEAARSQIGVPYSWGGGNADGPSYGTCCTKGGVSGESVRGFDCSGLMLYVFAKVGVKLPRVAEAQAGVGQRIPASAGVEALKPGDMVFFGNADGIYHVGLYIGGGQMLNAPKPGDSVKEAAVWNYDYAGGARVLQ